MGNAMRLLASVLALGLLAACITPAPTRPVIATAAPTAPPSVTPRVTQPLGASPGPITPTTVARTPANANVPPDFQSLYDELDKSLTAFVQSFPASDTQYPVTFAAELLPANGNRGTELLNPQTLQGTRVFLDRLQALGVQGVTVAIKYPLLAPDFPNSARYLEFYKSVASDIRKRNMKMDVEVGVIFPPPFSTLNVNYKAMTLDQYKAKNREMVATIVSQIQPDYLDLGAEPDTEARITGWRQLNTPQGYTDVMNYALQGMNRGNTKIGAGIGSWGSLDFVKSYGANTSLDFIAIHVYPVTGQALQTAVAAADLAHQYNKRVILDEAWLYKTSATEPAVSIAANSDIFRRDTYSFWAPLDQKFFSVIAKVARTKNIEYVSPFWATNLFAYLDYNPQLQTTPYNDVVAQLNAQAVKSMMAGQVSSTGEFYRDLIGGAR